MDSQDPAELKNLGNTFIKEGNVLKATEAYTAALKLPNSDNKLTFFLYSNRSYSNFLLGNYNDALYDACKAIETDSSQFKGYLRRSNVLEQLFYLDESIDDINTAIKLSQNPKENDTLASRLTYLQNLKKSSSNQEFHFNEPPYAIKVKKELTISAAKTLGEFVFDSKGLSFDNANNFFSNIKNLFKSDSKSGSNDIIRITAEKVKVLGNIYGDLGKLYEFFDKNGYPSKENVYLINGNFIGDSDHRIIIILFLFKAAEPSSIYFTKSFFDSKHNMKAEKFVEHEFGAEVSRTIIDTICEFPSCIIVNEKYAVMSGGPPVGSDCIYGQFSSNLNEGIRRVEGYQLFSFGRKEVAEFLSDQKCECLITSNRTEKEGFEIYEDIIEGENKSKYINVSFAKKNPNFKTSKCGYVEITSENIEARIFDTCIFPLEVHYDESKNYFQGVFYTMRKYTNENPAKNGMIAIYAISEDFTPVSNTIDSSIYEFDYMSIPQPGSWILVDFKERKMKVENYSIESARLGKNNDHMKSWKVEGSNDGKYWNVIDIENNVEELNGPMCNQVFGIKENAREFFRYIRILQHKKNHRGNWNLCLGHFDLFGTIK